jgi:hypothetical protein
MAFHFKIATGASDDDGQQGTSLLLRANQRVHCCPSQRPADVSTIVGLILHPNKSSKQNHPTENCP